jgi:glyoxylase-like metal-dependent hydrolase (beta-lactamase superfamily II)
MEIIPGVHRVPGLRGANAYLLIGLKLTLVDAGMPGSDRTILDYIEGLGLPGASLDYIVVTHHHLDHVGSLAAIRESTGAEVLAHAADAPIITGERPPPPASGGLMRFLFRLLSPVLPKARSAPVDRTLQDGDRLDILGGAVVVHAPGHTPGCITLHFPAERLLVCGDVIDHRRGRLGPPPKPFTEDRDRALASLRRLAELDFEVLCPGHGPPITTGAGDQVRAMVRALG